MQLIRSNMKKEIITQLIGIVIFMTYPLVVPMQEFSRSVYYVFMFLISIMTIAYVIKLFFFLKKNNRLAKTTKDAVQAFIYETRLTLEVYKSFVTAGSIVLPIPVFALLAGNELSGNQLSFEKWFLLNIDGVQIATLVLAYLVIAIIFYFITVRWSKMLYGKYLTSLDEIIEDLN